MNQATFQKHYQASLDHPEQFWAEQAKRLDWIKPWQTVFQGSFHEGKIAWFPEGKLNVSVNCIDRHLPEKALQTALIWEGDTPGDTQTFTFQDLYERVCRFANVLKHCGIQKGDRVCIYLPMIPEAAIAMLACARMGAVHSVVFGGFSAEAIKHRVVDAQCKLVITTDQFTRGGRPLHFHKEVAQALSECDCVQNVLLVAAEKSETLADAREIYWQDIAPKVATDCAPEPMSAEDPLFILYTSGSTGKPKGVLHTTAGYLLYAALTHQTSFGIEPNDIYWCTADVGWITGHSYIVYGPLANGVTTLLFAGTPTYPDAGRFWQVVDDHKVTIFYTAPTAIRLLMAAGDEILEKSSRQSLRVLGTVGEPINPEVWRWYAEKVGQNRCPIIDTWWQTETGGFMLAPPLEKSLQKPGAAMRPFWGIEPALLDEHGQEIEGPGEGALVIKQPWPGMMRTVYEDHERFIETYLKPYPGYYFSGDKARRDEDGDFWILGRMDDVLNIAGHRLGTAEVESALVLHQAVAEAAVVGISDSLKGEAMVAFVILMQDKQPSETLKTDLIKLVRHEIGPVATIKHVIFAPDLPKTRSGKIMRRILRKLASGETQNLGDTSTLNNPACVQILIESWGQQIQHGLPIMVSTAIPPVTFVPLAENHFSLLFEWLQRPHIKAWWMGPSEPKALEAKYRAYLLPNSEVKPFMVCKLETPIAYVQYYTFGSPQETLPPHLGIDIFIGEPSLLGQGFGKEIVTLFSKKIFTEQPHVKKLIVDPSPQNIRAIKCFKAAGFMPHPLYLAPDEPQLLMELGRK